MGPGIILLIALILVAAIAVPLVLMRQRRQKRIDDGTYHDRNSAE